MDALEQASDLSLRVKQAAGDPDRDAGQSSSRYSKITRPRSWKPCFV